MAYMPQGRQPAGGTQASLPARPARATVGHSTPPAFPSGGFPMRSFRVAPAFRVPSAPPSGEAPGKFPPDSLVNTKVIPHNTPVQQVVGIMRNFTGDLGVRCQFCHV